MKSIQNARYKTQNEYVPVFVRSIKYQNIPDYYFLIQLTVNVMISSKVINCKLFV